MSQSLVANGYAVTVDAARNVHAAGFVVIDGAKISAPSERPPKTLAHVKFARSLLTECRRLAVSLLLEPPPRLDEWTLLSTA